MEQDAIRKIGNKMEKEREREEGVLKLNRDGGAKGAKEVCERERQG